MRSYRGSLAVGILALVATAAPARAQDEGLEPPPPADAPAAAPAREYAPEALALLPRETLDEFPEALTQFLRPEHWVELRELCGRATPQETLDCLASPEGQELGETLSERGVVASLLERMDMMLPRVLAPEDLNALADLCETPGDVWAKCVVERTPQDPACAEPEEALAACIVGNDAVTELYLEIADQKQAAFGDELYVGFAGLLAVLDLETITAVRAACPQTDPAQAMDCLVANELVSAILEVYAELALSIVEAAEQEILAAGNTIDKPAYFHRVLLVLLAMPAHTIATLASECERQHPELAVVTDTGVLDRALECIDTGAETDPVANPAYISEERLRAWLGVARAKVMATIEEQEKAAQFAAHDRVLAVLTALGVLACLGVLLMPLVLGRRYPGQTALLWRSSAVAAATFAVTLTLLGASLTTVRFVQGAIGTTSTSPKVRVADGAFTVLESGDYVELFSAVSRERLDLIKKPLRAIVNGTRPPEDYGVFAAYLATHWADLLDEPELRTTARNAAKLKDQSGSFKAVFAFCERVDWVMGIVPILLALLAVVLYLLPLRTTLVDIATAPARAAKEGAATGDTASRAMRMVWREVKATLPFLGVIFVLLPVTGVFLAAAVQPVLELLIAGALQTFAYLWLADASTAVLYLSLGAAILLLVACLAVYILATVFYLGTARKAFRAIFHDGRRWGELRRLWTWGTACTLWVLALPLAYLMIIRALAAGPLASDADVPGTGEMLTVPLIALLAFPLVFWAARGWRALMFIKTYPMPAA